MFFQDPDLPASEDTKDMKFVKWLTINKVCSTSWKKMYLFH